MSKRKYRDLPKNVVERTDTFDEVRGDGGFHVERMDDGFLWARLGGKTYEIHSRSPIYVREQ